MKDQNKTRFTVGMEIIVLDYTTTHKAKILSVDITNDVVVASVRGLVSFTFNLQGYDKSIENPFLIAFTLPEYEALKALTDSFVDGTFGKEQVNTEPKEGEVGYKITNSEGIVFRPTIDEMVVYDDKELNIESMYRRASIMCVLSNRAHTAIGNLSPVIGYEYANGFCIPLLKEEQTNLEQNAQPEFKPQKGEYVLYNGEKCFLDVNHDEVANSDVLVAVRVSDDAVFSVLPNELQPIVGYHYENGFYSFGNSTEQPAPETTDLLDENGQPVYFCEEMKVGCLYMGLTGKVTSIDKNSICPVNVTFTNGKIVSYTNKGAYHKDLGIVLYPIEQYNSIILPKLNALEVTKPKEDVIELPSWFKGGAFLYNAAVLAFINSQGIEVENSFNEAFTKLGIAISDCTFFRASTVDSYFAIDFTNDNKLYNIFISMEKFNADIYIAYRKNGKNIAETL